MESTVLKSCSLALVILFPANCRDFGADIAREQAWEILRVNVAENSTAKRVQAVHVLALLPGPPVQCDSRHGLPRTKNLMSVLRLQRHWVSFAEYRRSPYCINFSVTTSRPRRWLRPAL